MEYTGQEEVPDLISLNDSEPEDREHLIANSLQGNQENKLNDESTDEPVGNQVTSSTPSENSSCVNKSSKPNLKDIQLVPINKVPGKKNRLQPCGHLMGTMNTSTSNFIGHLVLRHLLTEAIHKQKQKQSTQQNIGQMFQQMAVIDSKRKESQDQKFVSMLVKDQMPISIRDGTSLIEFLAEFDPNYKLPNEKLCRKLLTDAFVSSKE
ncbi:7758_t:CDS:2, partial [Racocetra fulgida]